MSGTPNVALTPGFPDSLISYAIAKPSAALTPLEAWEAQRGHRAIVCLLLLLDCLLFC